MPETLASDTPFFTIPQLVELLNLNQSRVRRLIEEHYLAAVRVEGVLKVPAEFVQDARPVPPLRGTLLVLMDAGFTNDEAVAWLLADNDEIGERPIDSLRAGRKSAVRRATQGLAF